MGPVLAWVLLVFVGAVGKVDGFWTSNASFRTASGLMATAGRRGLLQVCGPGQFMKDFRKEEDGPCMNCDINCLAGECVDTIGCNVCVAGFYRTRVDDLWPFDCVNCRERIPNCRRCKDGVFSEEPVQCDECDGDFVTNDARDACVCPESFQLDFETNTCVPAPSGVPEEPTGVAGVAITLDSPQGNEVLLPQEDSNLEEIILPRPTPIDSPTCEDGQFLAQSGDVCIDCDPNCEPDACFDFDGCLQCKDGFFGSSFLGTGPLRCRACSAPDCLTCVDDFVDASSVACIECSFGFVEQNGVCVRNEALDESSVLSQSQPADDQNSDKSSEQHDSFKTVVVDLSPADASDESPDDGVTGECEKQADEDVAQNADIAVDAPFVQTEDGEPVTFAPAMEVDLSSELPGDVSLATLAPLPFQVGTTLPAPVTDGEAKGGNPGVDEIGAQSVEVALDEGTTPENTAATCQPGQFVKKMDNSCATCDPNCAGNACVDFDGCVQCQPGFFTTRRDEFWPYECFECDIENCEACQDGNFDSIGAQCAKCVAGFVVGDDGKSCSPAGRSAGGETAPDAQMMQQPGFDLPIGEQSIDVQCGENSFRKEFDMQCMECDANCSPGNCVDRTGCDKCLEGFYRTRPDHDWPFSCQNCREKIPNCRQCRDGVFDAWPVLCAECDPTFTSVDGGAGCACEDGLTLNEAGDTCIPA